MPFVRITTLDFITTAGERHRATSCDGDTDMRVMAVLGPVARTCSNWWMYLNDTGPGQALVEVHAAGVNFMDIGVRQGLFWPRCRIQGARRGGRGKCAA